LPFQIQGSPEPTALKAVQVQLYETLLLEDMAPRLVDLTVTGVDYEIAISTDSVSFSFSGFAPAMQHLAGKVMEAYSNFSKHGSQLTAMTRFNRVKKEIKQGLGSYVEMPMNYAINDRAILLTKGLHSNEELLGALGTLSADTVFEEGPKMSDSQPLKVTALGMGNLAKIEAEIVMRQVWNGVPGAALSGQGAGQVERITRIVKPPAPVELRKLNPRSDDPNDVVIVSVLFGVANVKTRVRFSILGDILSTLAYEKLRTDLQLGYVANGGKIDLGNVLGMSCLVQGIKLKADAMEAAIEEVYHTGMPKVLAELTEKEFKARVHSFVQGLMAPPTTYDTEFDNFWGPVAQGGQCFGLEDEILLHINDTLSSKQDLIDEWDSLMSSGVRRKVSIKYFAGSVPPRPSLEEARKIWVTQGVPQSAFQQLEQEHKAAIVLDKADSSARQKLADLGGYYPPDLWCTAACFPMRMLFPVWLLLHFFWLRPL
jgi:secreted Zn-dependent insulinase-like peptidase